MIKIRTALLLGSAIGTSWASAHHGSSGLYDEDNRGTIIGELTSVAWRNPHVRIQISRDSANGPEEWSVEFTSVNTMERLGIPRDIFAVGEPITVSGRLGRNGRQAMFADSIELADGRAFRTDVGAERTYGVSEDSVRETLRAGSAGPRTDIFRVWIPVQRPLTGRRTIEYPLTDAGRARQAMWNPDEDPALRCIPPGMPTAMDNPYPIQFVQRGNDIVLLLEEWDGVRTIHMSDDGDDERNLSLMGYSVGRWDGDTLVVETTDIEWPYFDDMGTPQSPDAVITERFTPSTDGTHLSWEAQITDPENFTEPVVQEVEWIWAPDEQIKSYNCTLSDEAP